MPNQDHAQQVRKNIEALGRDQRLQESSLRWINDSANHRYSYNFLWLGRPIIQYPQDVVAMQELIWSIQPDLIIETGIAHGGSLILHASMLAMIDYCESVHTNTPLAPHASKRRVVGIDVDIRPHNRAAIEAHPLAHKITMIEGSSTAPSVVEQVRALAKTHDRILLCLDSMHTHDHVLAELKAYADLVSVDSYCVVFDTIVEDLGEDKFPDRPWGPGNSPKTAVKAFLVDHPEFEIDQDIPTKLQITVAPDGYLKRVRK